MVTNLPLAVQFTKVRFEPLALVLDDVGLVVHQQVC